MPENNQYYQAPQEVNGFVNTHSDPIPSMPVTDVYSLLGITPKALEAPKKKNPYEILMEGGSLFKNTMADVAPIQTNLATIQPLDDAAGLFHSQDGFGKYGYSSILNNGDNEDRYSSNFKKDNPSLFFQPGFHPIDGIKKAVYWGGGFVEKTLESAVVKTGQGLAGLYGLTVGNVIGLKDGGYSGISDWLSRSTDNIFSKAFDSWDDNLKERYHYFQEKSDRDKKGFIASLSDGDFWMNDVSDGLGFLASAAFEVGLLSKLNLGTKLASRLAPLAEAVPDISAVAGGAGEAGTMTRVLNKLGLEGSGHTLVKNAVDMTSQTLATTAIESASEAQEVKDKVYQSFEGKINPETGRYYSDDERKRLAANAAAQVFQQNMTILIAPHFLETLVFHNIGSAFKRLVNPAAAQSEIEAGKASSRVRSRIGNFSSSEESLEKASALKNIWKVGSTASLGFISEGLWEENVQLAISRSAEQGFGGNDEFYRPGTKKENIEKMKSDDDLFGEVGRRYWNQTKQFAKGAFDDRFVDDELSKSIGIGGLFGVGGGSIHSIINLRQQAKVDHYWNTRLNAATANLFQSQNFYKTETVNKPDPKDPTKTVPSTSIVTDPKTGQPLMDEVKIKTFLNKMNNIQGLMDVINNTQDPNDESNKLEQNKELNKLARNVLFTQLAMEYIRAGKKDTLLSNLASASNFSDKDIQALGYEPGNMSVADKKNMLTKMTKIVDKLSKTDEWIENNILDNISEPRQGFGGMKYTKTQKLKRAQELEAKKAYLRGLAMQHVLIRNHLDELDESDSKLGEPQREILSSVLGEDGVPVMDYSVPFNEMTKDYNAKIPALKNHIDVLQKEFAYHWENVKSHERNAAKAQGFSKTSKTLNGTNLAHSQLKADEALGKINELQAQLDDLTRQRNQFLGENDNFELVEEDGNHFVLPKAPKKDATQERLDELQNDKTRRLNNVKREELGIQQGWLNKEWQLTAALKEEKTAAGRKETYFSRRMSLSRNAYNTYFQREVQDRDNELGQRKLKLYHKDEAKRVNEKKYKANEEKLLKVERIRGKVASIISDVNGKKLLTEVEALLEKELPVEQFTTELKAITDSYNGNPIVLGAEDRNLISDQIENTQDEADFVNSMMEYMPEDDRFNDKYYDMDADGRFVIKPEYDSLEAIANLTTDLNAKIDELTKIQDYLKSIPEEVPGDWNNINLVRKRIADAYFESTDIIIDSYNKNSNNGQSEMAGDALSTKQDLDKVEEEIKELGQLKTIFEDRHKKDMILTSAEFTDFIQKIDDKIAQLEKIREIVKERMNSRLRENHDFLVDTVNNHTEQLGLGAQGEVTNQPVLDKIQAIVTEPVMTKLKNALAGLKTLMESEQTEEVKRQITDAYWDINGQVAAIQEIVKTNETKNTVTTEISEQKKAAIAKLEGTALMKKLKGEKFYKDIMNNVGESVLGVLQLVFYNSGKNAPFTQVGVASKDDSFIDDQAASPIYKFREDYNLRKLIRNVTKDESRTSDKTETTKEELLEFLNVMKEIQNLQDLEHTLGSDMNMLQQIETERKAVQEKISNKDDDKYKNLIVSSIQQIFFMRAISSFLRRKTGVDGFKNWSYIQAPGGSGKTQTLGTWFSVVSGISRDKIIATAFTEEAARGIKKALLVGEDGPKDVEETISFIANLTKAGKFDHDVLIIDEFPAIDVTTQKRLLQAIQEYSKQKEAAGLGEFKVITMGDTNQLTFNADGSLSPNPSIIINPKFFGEESHPAQMTIIPSLTVNFRSNIFAVTSFIDQFKGSNKDNVNSDLKATSTDPSLESKDVKGVVGVSKSEFKSKIIDYIKKNLDSNRTRTLIVNESKIDEYKKLLTDNGIKVITDPNDELTKGGVYVSTVKNVQGFSFDEVFVDFENNDKTLFASSNNLNYVYNKSMYVAASRARNLIVVTNFPNIENLSDDSINSLENKSLTELQTKDADFVANRDSEIKGAKEILGDKYADKVKETAQETTKEKVEPVKTVLDEEEEVKPEENEEEEVTTEEPVIEPEEEEVKPEEVVPETEEGEEDQIPSGPEVIPSEEDETPVQEEEVAEKLSLPEYAESLMKKVKDETVKAFDKLKSGIVELLFPTGQTMKYKMTDGDFTVNPKRLASETYENKQLQEEDKVILIPFRQQHTKRSNRKFGYAVVSPAIDADGNEIPNSYRTVSILSDKEINRFKNDVGTEALHKIIEENEKRDPSFVQITYDDLYNENGFNTSTNKIIRPLITGTVKSVNPIRYFYKQEYQPMNAEAMSSIIDKFINSYYKNVLENLDPAERLAKLKDLKNFYADPANARIVIPNNPDVIETPRRKARLDVPPELRPYVRPGRPYLVFKSFDTRGSMQFIGLSRKFLNTREHNHILEPVMEFMRLGKQVRDTMKAKGINERFGYSKELSNLISRVANSYKNDPNKEGYSFTISTTNRSGVETIKNVEFNNIEAERIQKLFEMYSVPATNFVTVNKPEDIKGLLDRKEGDDWKRRRVRTYIFDNGTTVIGTLQSYDPNTKIITVRDAKTGETKEMTGTFRYAGRAVTGVAQQALDNIMSANGHISKNFVSGGDKVGFVTQRGSGVGAPGDTKYKFMALLGSKVAAVVKSYNEDGTPKEYYKDIFDILDDLFTFDKQGELQSKKKEFVDSENKVNTIDTKFRVPVPIAVKDGDKELRHDYSNTVNNSSRETVVNNARYFETNFDNLMPTRVMVKFEEEKEEAPEVEVEETTEAEVVTPVTTTEEKKETLPNLTTEEIQELSFKEIRERMTPEQVSKLDAWAKENGFGTIDEFFQEAESSFEAEQRLFKKDIIDCIL